MVFDRWKVNVLSGDGDVDMTKGPVAFGTPTVTVGDDGNLSDPSVPMIYGPVQVRSSDGELMIQKHYLDDDLNVDGGRSIKWTTLRSMHRAQLRFEWTGSIRAEGFEVRSDGLAVYAVWEIDRWQGDDPECICGHPIDWHREACVSQWSYDTHGDYHASTACDCNGFTPQP